MVLMNYSFDCFIKIHFNVVTIPFSLLSLLEITLCLHYVFFLWPRGYSHSYISGIYLSPSTKLWITIYLLHNWLTAICVSWKSPIISPATAHFWVTISTDIHMDGLNFVVRLSQKRCFNTWDNAGYSVQIIPCVKVHVILLYLVVIHYVFINIHIKFSQYPVS